MMFASHYLIRINMVFVDKYYCMIRLITLKAEEGTQSIKKTQPHLSLVQSVKS